MTRFRIRSTDDLDTIADMDRQCFTADEAGPVDLDSHAPECWLATAPDGTPAAYAVAVIVDGVAYLRRAGVLPEYRGRGLQARLIRARIRWADDARAARVETYTLPENAASMRSLMRYGFKPSVPAWAYVGGGVVYWRRDLHS